MFEKEAEEYAESMAKYYESTHGSIPSQFEKYLRKAVEYGYNKANEWHYVKDGDLPRQDGNTCFSIKVLANNKKWVYYQFSNGMWFCENKAVIVLAWKEIVFPEFQ